MVDFGVDYPKSGTQLGPLLLPQFFQDVEDFVVAPDDFGVAAGQPFKVPSLSNLEKIRKNRIYSLESKS